MSPSLVTLAHDPQTSGGLLAAVPRTALAGRRGVAGGGRRSLVADRVGGGRRGDHARLRTRTALLGGRPGPRLWAGGPRWTTGATDCGAIRSPGCSTRRIRPCATSPCAPCSDVPPTTRTCGRRATAATRTDPIAAILAAQDPAGWWEKPGPGYATKYRGTVWPLIFLDQLGADPAERRVRAACDYVLAHSQARTGGFAASGVATRRRRPRRPPSSTASTGTCCARSSASAGSTTSGSAGRSTGRRRRSPARAIRPGTPITPGPGFGCGANEGLPCAWGATKALLALARIPPERRSPAVAQAIEASVEFLLVPRPGRRRLPDGLRQHEAERLVVQARASRPAT